LSTEELDEVVSAQNKVIEAQNERIARIEAVLQL